MTSDPRSGASATPPGGTGPDGSAGLVGTILAGRYRILRLLGEGAMGSVYLGEHLLMGRKDAIKVLKATVERDAAAVARFTRGARNASSIRHAHVCTVYDFGQTEDGRPFLAMELVEGEELGDILAREGPLPAERCVDIVAQAAEAVQAAHDRGIVHRDLKPGNIMVGRSREGRDDVKVVDFDIAKESVEAEGDEVTRLGLVVGTPEYMSPEQLTGDPLDGRSDVYSLGVILFKMLTGVLPHRNDSTHEMMVARLTTPPASLAEASPGRTFPSALQEVLDRALARRPGERYATAEAFRTALTGALVEPPVDAEQETVVTDPPRPAAPRPPAGARDGGTPASVGDPRAPELHPGGAGRRRWIVGAGTAAVAVGGALVAVAVGGGGGDLTVQVDPARLDLVTGAAGQLVAVVLDEDGRPRDASPAVWSTDAPEVATVDAGGQVRAVGPGRARVSARMDGASGEAMVTVAALPPLQVEPASIAFTFRRGGAPSPQNVAVRMAGISLADVTARPDGETGDWIRANTTEQDGDWVVSVAVASEELAVGRHEATLRVTGEAGAAGQPVVTRIPVVADVTPGESPPRPIRIAAGDAEAVTERQFLRLDEPGALAAARDTMRAVLDVSALETETRAFAAYVYALILQKGGESAAALEWARTAVDLDPSTPGYRTLLQALERDA